MHLSYNKLIDLPILAENKTVANLKDIVLDHENGLFLSLITSNNLYVLAKDIKKIENNKIVIDSSDSLRKINEIPLKIKNVIKKNVSIKNNNVYTQSGENLGRVLDFEIDLITNTLSRLYASGGNIIKKLIRGELIINKEQIISIKKDKITVKDIIAIQKQNKRILPEQEKELAGVTFCIKTD